MKTVVLLDTSIADTNTGNEIIMDAVTRETRSLLAGWMFFRAPVIEHVELGRPLLERADLRIVGGTNLLAADLKRTGDWRLRPGHVRWLRGLVLLGVGWWQYQSRPLTRYTRRALRTVLEPRAVHSVRDGYTRSRLAEIGVESVNTGCPSLWSLDGAACASLPDEIAPEALLTFTLYNQDPARDRALYETVRGLYQRVHVWPQGLEDAAYAREIAGDDLSLVDPTLAGLDAFLDTHEVDYVGTRLHAGIRAMQRGRRALIVAIDNRAAEMGRDFNLPIIARDAEPETLRTRLRARWRPEIRLDHGAVQRWRDSVLELAGAG